MVITVIAGKDSDLLDSVLRVPASLAVDDHHFHWEWWALGALASLVLLVIATARLRKQRQRRFSKGGLA
jgi:bacteriorhodopsin